MRLNHYSTNAPSGKQNTLNVTIFCMVTKHELRFSGTGCAFYRKSAGFDIPHAFQNFRADEKHPQIPKNALYIKKCM
jgi:hypothetical protein